MISRELTDPCGSKACEAVAATRLSGHSPEIYNFCNTCKLRGPLLRSSLCEARRAGPLLRSSLCEARRAGPTSTDDSINIPYKKLEAKILLLGEPGVGKTSLMENLARARQKIPRYEQYTSPTIGVDFKIIRSNLPTNLKLVHSQLSAYDEIRYKIWDASGSERFHPLVTSYYRNIDALVIVCNLCDRGSFQQIRGWLEDFNQHSDRNWSEIPTILVGNKSDLFDLYQVKSDELSALAQELKVTSLTTNVKDISPEKIIDQLNLLLVNHWIGIINYYQNAQRLLDINKSNQTKNCCSIT